MNLRSNTVFDGKRLVYDNATWDMASFYDIDVDTEEHVIVGKYDVHDVNHILSMPFSPLSVTCIFKITPQQIYLTMVVELPDGIAESYKDYMVDDGCIEFNVELYESEKKVISQDLLAYLMGYNLFFL